MVIVSNRSQSSLQSTVKSYTVFSSDSLYYKLYAWKSLQGSRISLKDLHRWCSLSPPSSSRQRTCSGQLWHSLLSTPLHPFMCKRDTHTAGTTHLPPRTSESSTRVVKSVWCGVVEDKQRNQSNMKPQQMCGNQDLFSARRQFFSTS